MRQSWLWAVIATALGGCGPRQPLASETALAPVQALAQPEPAHDEVIELSPLDLNEDPALVADASPLRDVLTIERERLLGCWATSAGRITLSLELDSEGWVVGGSTEPAGGQEGIAAVADCVLSRARTWRFPSSEGGGTRVLVAPLVVASSSGEKR